ncbi:ROK family protein [Lentibacillus saliphilus]|uniref:ROK family protein n=1 Tax=Lentibacillus saliphilus TaxID=2737028 RepID=UPI001C30E53B|nr:ROK family protein [Lentibacillus saliphilus]
MKYAIGIDIGGTKIACGIVNDQGDVIQQETVKSDPSDREKMFSQVVRCVNQLMNHSSISMDQIWGIGAGVPGKIDREKGIAVFQNNLPWSNFPFVERIKDVFNIERVVIDNDVYMAAFAEWKQAQLQKGLFVYMTVSTGISSAIIQDGEFIRGAGFAGEIGLVPVSTSTAVTRLEQAASGPVLAQQANERFATDTMTGEALFAAYYDGDLEAKAIVDEAAESLTQGIYMINSLLDPHQIVFGGSVIAHNPTLLDVIKDKLDGYLIDEQKHILQGMTVSQLGNQQGIIGAGRSVFDAFK